MDTAAQSSKKRMRIEVPPEFPEEDDAPDADHAKTDRSFSDELDEVDKNSMDSFPASDPPGWWR